MINLDTTSTSPILPEVLTAFMQDLQNCNLNPAAAHGGGLLARALADEAKNLIAKLLHCKKTEIIFTSGATEATNLALRGSLPHIGARARVLLTTDGEHEATSATAEYMAANYAISVVRAKLNADGSCNVDDFAMKLRQYKPFMTSFLTVSNETGAVNDVSLMIDKVREISPRTLIHLDAVQQIGKLPFDFAASGADFTSIAGHKFGAPKGVGVLLKKENCPLSPLILGGGQQNNLRSGTENPPLYMAFARALEQKLAKLPTNATKVRALREHFLQKLAAADKNFQVISGANASPYVLSLSLYGLRGQTMLNALSKEGIYVSTGSACSAKDVGKNHVLQMMGLSPETIANALRLSFYDGLTFEDVTFAAAKIAELHQKYGSFAKENDVRN